MPSLSALIVYSLALAAAVVSASPLETRKAAAFPGFHLPANLTNGAYQVFLDANGQEIHERLPGVSTDVGDVGARSPALSLARAEQPLPNEIYCGCDHHLNQVNTDHAVQGIKNQLGGGSYIRPSAAWYTIWGDVVAFVCAGPVQTGVIVSATNFYWVVQVDVSNACGSYVAGTWAQRHWGSSNPEQDWDGGIMNYYDGLDFCAHAEGSGSHSC